MYEEDEIQDSQGNNQICILGKIITKKPLNLIVIELEHAISKITMEKMEDNWILMEARGFLEIHGLSFMNGT